MASPGSRARTERAKAENVFGRFSVSGNIAAPVGRAMWCLILPNLEHILSLVHRASQPG